MAEMIEEVITGETEREIMGGDHPGILMAMDEEGETTGGTHHRIISISSSEEGMSTNKEEEIEVIVNHHHRVDQEVRLPSLLHPHSLISQAETISPRLPFPFPTSTTPFLP